MCLNYATGVVEHVDLTVLRSFHARIRDDSCFWCENEIKICTFTNTISWRTTLFLKNALHAI